jgi:hypothetical protein
LLAQQREELAYKAQERWLKLFGRDPLQDFQLGPVHSSGEIKLLFVVIKLASVRPGAE